MSRQNKQARNASIAKAISHQHIKAREAGTTARIGTPEVNHGKKLWRTVKGSMIPRIICNRPVSRAS